MTQATQILREEHHWIRLLVDCLEALVAEYRSTNEFDTKTAKELQILFEHFVDEQHQEKEETALFPMLLECVQRLQDEHARERQHLDRMRFSLFNAALGDPASREEFAGEAQAYVDLQRKHVAQENLGLLPLAEQLLSKQDDEDVLEEFLLRDQAGLQRDDVQARVHELCRHLQVPLEPTEVEAAAAK